MSELQFDFDAVFAPDDYLYFYGSQLSPERTGEEVEVITRLLELEPGMEVLDLACGHGRIANRLAERGCRVVGLDSSPGFLELARRDAISLAEREGTEPPEYVLGDMRHLPWHHRFDRVVNWFTAYGYFDDEENRTVLRQMHNALKPGGQLLIELNNRDNLLGRLQRAVVVERDDNYMIDQPTFDISSGRMLTLRTVLRDGQVRRMHFSTRLFTFTELRDWLLAAGFESVDAFDEKGEPLSLASRRMLIRATAGASA
jgi:SAM-dependent methyltransferase